MAATSYSRLAGAIFALVALLQLMRAVIGLPVTAGDTMIPLWASWGFPAWLPPGWRGSGSPRPELDG